MKSISLSIIYDKTLILTIISIMSTPSSETLVQNERDIRSGDLYAYYKNNRLTLFVTRKNGLPDMRDAMNRYYYTKMIEQAKRTKMLHETSDSSLHHEESCKICPICYDPIKNGKVELGCHHTFCVDCFTKFYLKDNKCPMCRYEFIDKKFNLIDDEHISSLIGSAINMRIWNQEEQTFNYTEIVGRGLNYMNFMNQVETRQQLTNATERLMNMIATHIRDFYEKQMFMN